MTKSSYRYTHLVIGPLSNKLKGIFFYGSISVPHPSLCLKFLTGVVTANPLPNRATAINQPLSDDSFIKCMQPYP
jgi:hypothetical protein